jgi:hypothetical protein
MVQPKIAMQEKKVVKNFFASFFLYFTTLNLVFTQPKVGFQSTQAKIQIHTKCLPEFSFGWPEVSFGWPESRFGGQNLVLGGQNLVLGNLWGQNLVLGGSNFSLRHPPTC